MIQTVLSVEITFQASGFPANGPFTIFCDAIVPGRIDIHVVISGPASLSGAGGTTRGTLAFDDIRPSDSGMYNCSVLVGEVAEGPITAVLDASG